MKHLNAALLFSVLAASFFLSPNNSYASPDNKKNFFDEFKFTDIGTVISFSSRRGIVVGDYVRLSSYPANDCFEWYAIYSACNYFNNPWWLTLPKVRVIAIGTLTGCSETAQPYYRVETISGCYTQTSWPQAHCTKVP